MATDSTVIVFNSMNFAPSPIILYPPAYLIFLTIVWEWGEMRQKTLIKKSMIVPVERAMA